MYPSYLQRTHLITFTPTYSKELSSFTRQSINRNNDKPKLTPGECFSFLFETKVVYKFIAYMSDVNEINELSASSWALYQNTLQKMASTSSYLVQFVLFSKS